MQNLAFQQVALSISLPNKGAFTPLFYKCTMKTTLTRLSWIFREYPRGKIKK